MRTCVRARHLFRYIGVVRRAGVERSSAGPAAGLSWWRRLAVAPAGGSAPPGGAAGSAGPAAARGRGLGGSRRPTAWAGAWLSGRRSRAARTWCSCRRTRRAWRGVGGQTLASAGGDRRGGRAGAAGARLLPGGDGLRGLHGTPAAAIAAARGRWRRPARIGAGPTRFCALAAALTARSRRPRCSSSSAGRGAVWRGQPVSLLGLREGTEALAEPLGRLGVRTLGERRSLGAQRWLIALARRACSPTAWPAARIARFARAGASERIGETMEVGDASSGSALERVMGVLVDRLLARVERRGRTLCVLTLSARLATGGGWRERVVFRQALADPERIRLALSLRLAQLPAPLWPSALAVERFGPPASEQRALLDDGRPSRSAPARGGRADAGGRRPGCGAASRAG